MSSRRKTQEVRQYHQFHAFDFVPDAVSDSEVIRGVSTDKERIREFIHRRRRQLIIHSIIYYRLDDNLVSDDTWQRWAEELKDVQRNYHDLKHIGFHDELFLEWDGSTGMHLDLPEYYNQALQLLRMQ